MSEMSIQLARHDERISDLEEWREKHNQTLEDIRRELKEFGRRPTWAVTVVVSVLSSLCTGMALFIITGM